MSNDPLVAGGSSLPVPDEGYHNAVIAEVEYWGSEVSTFNDSYGQLRHTAVAVFQLEDELPFPDGEGGTVNRRPTPWWFFNPKASSDNAKIQKLASKVTGKNIGPGFAHKSMEGKQVRVLITHDANSKNGYRIEGFAAPLPDVNVEFDSDHYMTVEEIKARKAEKDAIPTAEDIVAGDHPF